MHASQAVYQVEDSAIVALRYENLQAIFFSDVAVDIFDYYVVEFVSNLAHFQIDILACVVAGYHYGCSYIFGLEFGKF